MVQNAAGALETLGLTDTQINGLTFVYGSTPREVENLLTREFEADPNLHKNANVELVGVYATDGSPSVSFEWTWKWKPPKPSEDKGGGWRNFCSVCVPPIGAAIWTFAETLLASSSSMILVRTNCILLLASPSS